MTTTDYDRARIFTRRAVVLGLGKLGLFALVGGRLYQLQVLDRARYATLAEENRINLRLLAPPRGQIMDRFGVPVALNQQNFRAIADPRQIKDLNTLLSTLQQWVTLEETDLKRIRREVAAPRSQGGVLIADNLSWEQVAALELRRTELPGLAIEPGAVRNYPYAEATAHILGYVGTAADKDLDGDPLLLVPGFRIGKSGFERQLEDRLRGVAGRLQFEVNAHGQVVRELDRVDPRPGEDVALSIDIGLQQFAQQRLSTEASAAAVVMDVQTGEVYALASHPSFDPNLFTFGIRQADWSTLNNDERAPLTNKCISGQYAPGSTFKMVTALAALEAGVVKPDETVYCPGHYDLGSHRFHCWKHGGHGNVSMVEALALSCDTYFYDIGRRVGIDRIQAVAKRLGLGAKTGIDLPHERAGLIPSRAWKASQRRQEWQQGETLINAIGQGFVLATPLQLAVMIARLVNGGRGVLPRLTRAGTDNTAARLRFRDAHLHIIRAGMDAVVNRRGATAFGARIAEDGLAMGGKTGTAQVRRISMAERETGVIKNENLPWRQRDHALFVGYAPVDAPRYAAAVVVEHGGSGSGAAAPIARDLLRECQKREPART